MPISSVSQVYDAPDPIMENDLELMAKVDAYQQSKFDAGAAALQNEVNNWALMANIAKPELKQYANEKLNKLVGGINNLGGVDLGDINNVNSLKSLGYNIYGDNLITDGVATTQRMKNLAASSQAKLSGKEGGKYDSAVADYLMKGYQEWANDGDIKNSKYDGPVDLPMGNMNTINEKVQKYLKELKPDSDSTPSGDLQNSYGYFQIDGKWLKGNRVEEAINAVTDENDALVFRSHGWKALGSDKDENLISKVGLLYDKTDSDIKAQINYLQTEINHSVNDAGKKLELEKLKAQQVQALATNQREKDSWYSKKQLAPQEREGIQESLYRNAWKSNVVNSYSYNQEKKELKTNTPLVLRDKLAQASKEFAANYNLNVKKYELDVRGQDFEEYKFEKEQSLKTNNVLSGNNLPLTVVPNTGENNEQKSPAGFMDDINAKYVGLNTSYYDYVYNVMGSNDSSGRFQQVNGQWKPKDQYRDQIEKEVGAMTTKLDTYSTLTDKEKEALNLPFSKDELKQVFAARNQINTYGAYHKIAEDKETEIINAAIAKNQIPGDWRKVQVTVPGRGRKSIEEVLALKKAGLLTDADIITDLDASTVPGISSKNVEWRNTQIKKLLEFVGGGYTLKNLEKQVTKLRDNASKSYQDGGGKLFNSFSVPIPFGGLSKVSQEVIKKQLTSKIPPGIDFDTVEPISGQIQMDFKTGQPQYFLNVQYGTGKKLATAPIDVTEMVKNSPSSGLGAFFPQSDVSLVWGLSMSKDGSTPFSRQDNYKDALRTTGGNYPYQISTLANNLNGTVGLKVKIALPVGGGKTIEVNVKNLQNGSTTFPSSVEAVQQYINDFMSTPELKAKFYKEHGLTLN